MGILINLISLPAGYITDERLIRYQDAAVFQFWFIFNKDGLFMTIRTIRICHYRACYFPVGYLSHRICRGLLALLRRKTDSRSSVFRTGTPPAPGAYP